MNRVSILRLRGGALLVAPLVVAVLFLSCGEEQGPMREGPAEEASALSDDQEIVESTLGPPAFFISNMAPDDSEMPPQANRYETWFYPDQEVSFTFFNGAYVGSDDIFSLPPETLLPSLRPEQVREGMSLAEVKDVLGEEPLATLEVPAGILEDSLFYEFTGVYAGLQRGELVYIETFPLVSAGASGRPNPPQEALVLVVAKSGQAPRTTAGGLDPAPVSSHSLAQVGANPALAKSFLEWIPDLWRVTKHGDNVKDAVGSVGLAAVQNEIKNARKYLEEEAGKLEARAKEARDANDPLREQQFRSAADKMRVAVNELGSLQKELDEQKPMAAIDLLNPIPFVGPGPEMSEINKRIDQFLKDKGGRQGTIRNSLQSWGEKLSDDWYSLDRKVREALITDLVYTRVKERCDPQGTADLRGDQYQDCFFQTLNDLRERARDWPTGAGECLDGIDRIRRQGPGRRLEEGAGFIVIALEAQMDDSVGGWRSSQGTCPARGGTAEAVVEPEPTVELEPTEEPFGFLSLSGTLELVGEDEVCFFSARPNTTGTIDIDVDLDTGEVLASFEGGGEGTRTGLECEGNTADLSWFDSYEGNFLGDLDPDSGAFSATGVLVGEGEWTFENCIVDGEASPCEAFAPLTAGGGEYSQVIEVSGTVDADSGIAEGSLTVTGADLPWEGSWSAAEQ